MQKKKLKTCRPSPLRKTMLRRNLLDCRSMPLAKTSRNLAIAFTLACAALVNPSPSLAQTTQSGSQTPGSQPQAQQDEAGVEDNPTRVVFLSIRNEYRNLRNGAWNNRAIIRKDALVLKGKPVVTRGLLLRADIPITTTHIGSETRTGLGDLYGQVLYIPHITQKFAFVAGSGVVLPTATHKTLGFGKWQVAPFAAPVWFLSRRKGFFLVRTQNFISVAGVGDRPDINILFVNPTLVLRPAKRWWMPIEIESRTNWKNDKKTDFRAGLGLGRVITPRFGLEVRSEVPFGGTRPGDWTIKFAAVWHR
jgi:hypothetical protein